MIEIVPYGPKWEQAHIAFASKYWTKSRRKIPDYIYWKFRGKPNQELSSFVLAISNNEVIGQLGLIPVNVVIEGEVYEAQWACDLMVDTTYRGKGVAKLLYEVAHSQKTITIGSDPSPAASASMQKSGYELIPATWKFIFPLNLNEVTRLKGINNKLFKKIPNPFILMLWIYKLIYKNTFRTVDFSAIEKHPFEDFKKKYAFVARDSDFINWRNKSFKDYYKGVELRMDNQKRFYSGCFVKNTYYLMDFWVEDSKAFHMILVDIHKRFKGKGLLLIRFFSIQEKFQFFGCLKFRTRSEIIYYTNSSALKQKLASKVFFYTYADSDENI